MALRLDRVDRPAGLVRGWHTPPVAHFMRSPGLEWFKREVARYLDSEVPGRAFLISGHRGMGKTSLVRRAVEELERSVNEAWTFLPGSPAGGITPVGSAARPQRPLLVKIHGPSLLAPPDAASPAGPAPVAPTAAIAAAAAPKVEAELGHALALVTVSLYRAFAAEVAACFARHARWTADPATPGPAGPARRPLPAEELLEAAAQLALDLDGAPDAALLRRHWRAAGRLDTGVLWPAAISERLVEQGVADMGLREIVAITTAAQAFQICTGTVTDTETRNASAAAERALEAKGEVGRDALRALLGLGAGVMVGFGLAAASAGGTAAVAGGGAAALLTSGGLAWSGRRAAKQDQARSYTFLKDRSLRTLERDLPLVIGRLREAGLAPVFVVDELDKVRNSDQVVQAVIARLKNLTTDDGLFCFLTDRDAFEALRPARNGRAFPIGHTLFSERLLLLYTPADAAAYLRAVLRTDAEEGSPQWQRDRLAGILLARRITARARLNTIDMQREIAALPWTRLPGRAEEIADPETLLRATNIEDRLHALVQVVVNRVLSEEARVRRCRADPLFAQLLHDTVYMPHRLWEAGEEDISDSPGPLLAHLLRRMHDDPKPDPARPGPGPEARFAALYPDCDPAPLQEALAEVLRLLADPSELVWRPTALSQSPPSLSSSDPVEVMQAEDQMLLRILETA